MFIRKTYIIPILFVVGCGIQIALDWSYDSLQDGEKAITVNTIYIDDDFFLD